MSIIWKIMGLLKAAWYKLRFGKHIRFAGRPFLEGTAKIDLEQGSADIGKALYVKTNTLVRAAAGGHLRIADHVSVNRNCMIICRERITIGQGCAFGPGVNIYDHDHNFGPDGIEKGYHKSPVWIGPKCWIGAGTTILRGTHIGEGCVIGAGCVVKGEIPPHSLVTSDRSLNIVPIENRDV